MARGGRPRPKVGRRKTGRRATRPRFTTRPPTITKTQASSSSKPRPIILSPPPRKPVTLTKVIKLKGIGKRRKSGEGITFSRGARGKIKARPTRVTVASPSGKGKTITVSSRSALARSKAKPRVTLVTLRRRKKTKPKGLRSRPRPDRPIPKKQKFGSDFDIFRVSDVGGQATTFKQSTRTGRTGKKKRTGVPQTTIRTTVSRVGKPKKPQPRLPPSSSPFVEGLFDIPLFIPRQVGKAVTQVTERISKKPLPKEDRAFGSDFDILNFFG